MNSNYKYFWVCKVCKHENSLMRTKHQAAFEHSPKLPPCKSCGGNGWVSKGGAMPDIDEDLLEIWFANPNFYFLEQDEDLIIAGADLAILKNFLNADIDRKARSQTLGPIIAVKLYNEDFTSPEDRQWCVDWLIENENSWVEFTMSYIIKKIRPILILNKSDNSK